MLRRFFSALLLLAAILASPATMLAAEAAHAGHGAHRMHGAQPHAAAHSHTRAWTEAANTDCDHCAVSHCTDAAHCASSSVGTLPLADSGAASPSLRSGVAYPLPLALVSAALQPPTPPPQRID